MTHTHYTFEIIAVDEAARSMEVVYTSQTHGIMHVGARLPFEGETLEDVIAIFAPVQEWRQRDLPVIVPQIGTKGQLTYSDTETAPRAPEPDPLWSAEDEAAFEAQIAAEAANQHAVDQ